MSSTTKTLPQLYEEEQTRSDLLQTKITRLERELDVIRQELGEAKDFEDKFVVQTKQLSIKNAALLDLQTAFDRASLRYDEELGMQRRDLEELLAGCRNHSLNALGKVESAMVLIQRSLKPSTRYDRKAKMVQGSKPSSIPGNTLGVHPRITSVQFLGKPYIVPQRREMSFRPSTKGDSNTLRVHPPIKSVQSIGKPYIIPQRREISFRPAMKGENLEATKNPARNQPVMDDGFTAPSPPAPTPVPKHQPKPQDEGSQLEPRLPTAGKVVDSGKPKPEPEPEQTFEDSTPAETSNRELQMKIKLLRNQLKDAVARDWDNFRPYLDEKLRKCCVDFKTELHGCKAELSKVNEQLSNASTNLLKIEANAKAVREENWALRRDLNTMRSGSKGDAQKQRTSKSAATAKAKITPLSARCGD